VVPEVNQAAALEWLETFFAEGNGWDLGKIRRGDYPPELQMRLDRLLRSASEGGGPMALPRLDGDKQLWFYVVARDQRELGDLAAVIKAYLGQVRSRSDYQVHLQSSDAVEGLLLQRFAAGFLRISIPKDLNAERDEVYEVFDTIDAALSRFAERPKGIGPMQRPIGRILSDFFVACDQGDGVAAVQLADELRASGRLSTRNLLSVQLQALAARRQWRSLLSHPDLPRLLSGRIPTAIVETLLKAVHETEIQSADPREYDLEALQSKLEVIGEVFRRPPGLRHFRDADLWRAWGIGAAALGYARAIDALPVKLLGDQWIEDLRTWGQIGPATYKSKGSFQSALVAPPSLDSAVSMLKQALVLDVDEGRAIYRRLSQYPQDVIKEIESHSALRGVWLSLQGDFSCDDRLTSWADWFRSLGTGRLAETSVQALAEACRQWEPASWREDEIRDLLFEIGSSDASLQFRQAIPVLRKWLKDGNLKLSATFVEQALLVIAVDEIHSQQDLILVGDLIGDMTAGPHTLEQYRAAVDASVEIWRRTKSVIALHAGLDLMDLLLDSVCADQHARQALWTSIQEFCIAEWRRLSAEQRLLVREAALAVLQTAEHLPADTVAAADDSRQQLNLAGKRLAIYTLMDGAARRAKAVLEALFPQLNIQLNHDRTATAALVNLANTVDYFIFSSQSAAHQAFYPVTQRRSDLLYPAGKGSSSIVRCFLDALEG
jgi:hypothetical protein